MPKTTWADIVPRDIVRVNGRPYAVAKVKPKGKSVKVTLADVKTGRTFDGKMPAEGKVERDKTVAPLRDARNGQARWATPKESAKAQRMEVGDVTLRKPPAKPGTDEWTEPRGKAERKLDDMLSARLVGEATDTDAGYYVPMPDVTTIASHMALFHPNAYDAAKDEATMLAGHEHAHRMARVGKARLDVNHWHTATRPDPVKA